jgi:hypothetical protein
MTTTETQPAPLAQLATAVRKLHATGWTWRDSTAWFGQPAEHRYVRDGLELGVTVDGEGVRVRAARGRLGAAAVLDLWVSGEAVDGSALVGLIAGLS